MTLRHLDRLLSPQSVAVFGASDKPARAGTTVWRNLLAGGFRGVLAPVNPRLGRLDGRPCFASVAALPFVPDLAVLCTPPATLARLVADLGARGTRAAIVVTTGLSAGQKQALLSAARRHALRLLGPDGIGLLSPRLGLNASLTQAQALPGDLALVSQSGAVLTALLDWANGEGIGFSHLVSLGEPLDVDLDDLLDQLATDRHTRAILLYIEGITAPRKFMSAARAAARVKPVIVVKAGRGGAGPRAAAASGDPVAQDIVFDAAIRRAGMLRVNTLKELFIAAQTLARFRDNSSHELMVVSNGGGAGVLVADAALALGVPLARPGEQLMQRLEALLPAPSARGNPIDLPGDASPECHARTLQALLEAPEAGALLFAHAPTAMTSSLAIAEACAPLVAAHPGRVLSCWLGGDTVAPARRAFEAVGIACYDTPEEAVRAFSMMHTYRRNQIALRETPTASANAEPDRAGARRIVDAALAARRDWLDDTEAKALLGAYGMPTATTGDDGTTARARRPYARELMLGAQVDPVFGPVLLFGQGRIAVDGLDERAAALPPLNRTLARELVDRSRVRRLLAGFRSHPPVDLDALGDALIAVARLLADVPELAELDINPLWADEQGVVAADARVRLSAAAPAGVRHFAVRPYPEELERRLVWRGQPLLLRPIRPEDEAAHGTFLQAVTPEDLRMRFFQAPHHMSHDELARLTQIDYEREMAFIAVDAAGQTLGVARLVRAPDDVEAEFAVLVRSDLKRQGLGRLLLTALIDHARAQGTRRIVGDVLRENLGMLALVRSLGFDARPDESEPTQVMRVSRAV